VLANRHLIAQALHPRLNRTGLSDLIPQVFTEHLGELYALNLERTRRVTGQSGHLNNLLKVAGIRTVFFKGAGYIADQLYPYEGERIIHDMDILVDAKDLLPASEVLMKAGYRLRNGDQPQEITKHKHFPPLYHPDWATFVEIHHQPAGSRFAKYLNTREVLDNCRPAKGFPDIPVMSDPHSMLLNFLHGQYSHRGRIYGREYLRSLYDHYLLSQCVDPETVFGKLLHFRYAFHGYQQISDHTFGLPRTENGKSLRSNAFYYRYFLNLKYRPVYIFTVAMLRIWFGLICKPARAITQSGVRQRMLKNLSAKKWYQKQFRFFRKLFLNR
jgi:hypothetical protein